MAHTIMKARIQPETPLIGLGWLKTGVQTRNSQNHLRLVMTVIGLLTLNTVVAQTNTMQLLSARNPSVPLTAGGNGDSIVPAISPNGRYVVFASAANDLTPGGNGRFVLNIYLRDRTAQTTTLVSANINGTDGGNDNSINPQVSSNGQFVVFQSDASDLVPNDTNGVTDIFMRNVSTGTTTLVSAASDGSPGNGASTDPIMTPDGRYVVFLSSATNLTSGIAANGLPDLFVRDMVLGTNYLISTRATNGGNVAITPNGRYLAFFSTATNLAPGVPATSQGEVYLVDRTAGTITWVSTNAAALALTYLGQSNAPSYHPRLSDDGQFVTFKVGGATNAPPGSGVAMILLYNSGTAATTVINTNAMGMQIGLDDDYGPEITPDGEFVAYVRHESDLPPPNPASYNSNYCSVHVWDSQGAVDTLVSDPGSNGAISTISMQPVLSAEGWFVAFLSNATNFVDDPVQSGFHIYLRNYLEGSLQLVDEDTNGVGSTDNQLSVFSLSRYGRYVAFDSPNGGLVGGDNNHAYDVFTRDLFSDTTEMVSKRDDSVIPQTGDYLCASQVSVSANGQRVAFASVADDLVPNDTNNEPDVFVRNLLTGTTTLVSAGADGGPALGGPSLNPVISADGRYVVFIGSASNLVTGQGNISYANVFRRDLQTGTTVLASSTNGIDAANSDCSSPVISQDGQFTTFLSSAPNLLPTYPAPVSVPGPWTICRDIKFGTTMVLPTNYSSAYSIFPPSVSGDGRYVAYSSYATFYQPQLRIWDTQSGVDIFTNSNSAEAVSNAVIDATGDRVLYSESGSSYLTLVDDVQTGTNIISFNYPIMLWSRDGWSADGRYLAFVAQTNFATGTNIYLCDIQSGDITLVSSNYTPIPGGTGGSDLPAISADGRFVVYRSYGSGIVPGDASLVPNIYRYDRLMGTNAILTAGQTGLMPGLWDSKPAINSDGRTVAFLSLGSGLVSVDLNRAPDAFAYAIDIGMPLDTDGDGIADWWMIQYFGHPTGQASDHSLAQDDADGDGMSNLQEYLAGTDPTDPQSVLRMTTVTVIKPGPEVDVSWSSVTNKIYFLERSRNLAEQPVFSVIQSNIVGQAGMTSYQDTNATGPGPFFYRVGVQQ